MSLSLVGESNTTVLAERQWSNRVDDPPVAMRQAGVGIDVQVATAWKHPAPCIGYVWPPGCWVRQGHRHVWVDSHWTADHLPLSAPASNLSDYRQQSALFSLTFPVDNIFGITAGSYDSVADGYWLALGPLGRGEYVLEFGASASGTPPKYPAFTLAQRYEINVVPEPATWSVLLTGLIALGAIAHGWKRV